jgi:hypothetical protein
MTDAAIAERPSKTTKRSKQQQDGPRMANNAQLARRFFMAPQAVRYLEDRNIISRGGGGWDLDDCRGSTSALADGVQPPWPMSERRLRQHDRRRAGSTGALHEDLQRALAALEAEERRQKSPNNRICRGRVG